MCPRPRCPEREALGHLAGVVGGEGAPRSARPRRRRGRGGSRSGPGAVPCHRDRTPPGRRWSAAEEGATRTSRHALRRPVEAGLAPGPMLVGSPTRTVVDRSGAASSRPAIERTTSTWTPWSRSTSARAQHLGSGAVGVERGVGRCADSARTTGGRCRGPRQRVGPGAPGEQPAPAARGARRGTSAPPWRAAPHVAGGSAGGAAGRTRAPRCSRRHHDRGVGQPGEDRPGRRQPLVELDDRAGGGLTRGHPPWRTASKVPAAEARRAASAGKTGPSWSATSWAVRPGRSSRRVRSTEARAIAR